MAHPQNQLETAPLRISTTKAVVEYLKDLVSTGLYGRHHTDAAERLITQGLERLLQQGTLKPRIVEENNRLARGRNRSKIGGARRFGKKETT
jgi:hypothetical protein